MSLNGDLMRFDTTLKVGDVIEARWTNCHRYYAGLAKVVKLHEKSLRVELLAEVPSQLGYGPYTIGHNIRLPRALNPTWSPNNCAAPVTETK